MQIFRSTDSDSKGVDDTVIYPNPDIDDDEIEPEVDNNSDIEKLEDTIIQCDPNTEDDDMEVPKGLAHRLPSVAGDSVSEHSYYSSDTFPLPDCWMEQYQARYSPDSVVSADNSGYYSAETDVDPIF